MSDKKDISNLFATAINDEDNNFFGVNIDTKTVASNIKKVRNKREKDENTTETKLNIEEKVKNGRDIVKISNNNAFVNVKATAERRLITLEQIVADSLDAIEKSVSDAFKDKYGKELKTRIKSEILNKILKAGLKSSLGIEVD